MLWMRQEERSVLERAIWRVTEQAAAARIQKEARLVR
jgi:hypothetical protein